MAAKGKVNDLFDLKELEKQQKGAISLVEAFIKKVDKANKTKIELQGASDPSKIIAAIKKIQAEQKELNKLLLEGAKRQNESAKAAEEHAKSNKKNTDSTKESTKANEDNKKSLDEVQKIKQKIAATETDEAKQKAFYNQQLKESNRDLATNARLENAVSKSIDEAKAKIQQLIVARNSLNTSTDYGKRKQIEYNIEIAKLKGFIKTAETKGLDDAYKNLALRFAAAAKEAKNLAITYGVLDPRTKAAAEVANDFNNQLKAADASVGIFNRNVGNYPKVISGFASSIGGLTSHFLSLIGVVGVGSILSSAVDEFIEMDKNVRILQNTLRNLGVPEAFARIEQAANSLQEQFKFLDNDDILKTFNQLIVYGKLTEDQINELIPVIINFATATGKDLNDATGDILKALEGNSKELKKFGINMKDAKDPTEAFSLIMKELAPRVNGVGKAFQDSAAGGLAVAKQQFKDMKEEIGAGLLPALNTILSTLIQGAKNLGTFFKAVKEGLAGGSGFYAIAKAQIDEGSYHQLAVQDQTEQIVNGYNSLQKNIEVSLGRTLTKSKEDQALLKQQQKAYIDQQKKLLAEDQDINGKFKQDFKRNKENFLELRSVITGIESKTAALQTIDIPDQQINPIPTFGGSDGGESKKNLEDFKKDLLKVNEDIRRANFENQKRRIQDEIDTSQDIIDNETKSYEQRLTATQIFYDKTKELLDAQLAYDKETLRQSIEEEKRQVKEKLSEKDLSADQKKDLNETLLALDKKYYAESELLKTNYYTSINDLDQTSEKQRLSLAEKEVNKKIKLLEKEQAERDKIESRRGNITDLVLDDIQNGYDQELLLLDQKFNRGEIREKDYSEKRLRLITNLNKSVLEVQIDSIKQEIEAQKAKLKFDKDILEQKIKLFEIEVELNPTPENIDALASAKQKLIDIDIDGNLAIEKSEKKLNALQIQLGNVIGEFFKKKKDQRKQDFEELFAELSQIAQTTFDIIGGFIENSVDREKNAIEEQIRALDKKTQAEIEAANLIVGTAEEKAARIAIIEARANAQKEQFELKQRQQDERKARFEKARAILNIIINTAQAITAFLKDANIPGAIAAGIIGAAQLAVAIASDIPKYKEGAGVNGKPAHKGGLAEVGHGKSELIAIPGGMMYKTPDTPIVVDLPPGTIVHPDYDKAMINSTLKDAPLITQKQSVDMSTPQILLGLIDVQKAIEKLPQPEITVENLLSRRVRGRGGFTNYINRKAS